jgi:hypothetical protein
MARKYARLGAMQHQRLTPLQEDCPVCGHRMQLAYHSSHAVLQLSGVTRFALADGHGGTRACDRHRRAYRREAEGGIALPKSEIGLDVMALVGNLRFGQHRSLPEIHQDLQVRGVTLAQRSVTNLLDR